MTDEPFEIPGVFLDEIKALSLKTMKAKKHKNFPHRVKIKYSDTELCKIWLSLPKKLK